MPPAPDALFASMRVGAKTRRTRAGDDCLLAQRKRMCLAQHSFAPIAVPVAMPTIPSEDVPPPPQSAALPLHRPQHTPQQARTPSPRHPPAARPPSSVPERTTKRPMRQVIVVGLDG